MGEENSRPTRIQTPVCPACSLVTIPTTLSQITVFGLKQISMLTQTRNLAAEMKDTELLHRGSWN